MPVDFRDAAERHWEDAEYLMADTRLANADHLFGLSGECALKAVMLDLDMDLRPDGAPANPQHRVHINQLWNEFISFANARSGAHYASRLSTVSNPFENWAVSQRYSHREDMAPWIVEAHQQAAKMAKQVLDDAILNGDIE